jgi:hypothetical protein
LALTVLIGSGPLAVPKGLDDLPVTLYQHVLPSDD